MTALQADVTYKITIQNKWKGFVGPALTVQDQVNS